MKNLISALLLTPSLFFISSVQAQGILWQDADEIAPGAPVRAAGIVEIRDAVDEVRTDLDSGSFGDDLGNHTATSNLNMGNRDIDNLRYADIQPGNGNGIRFWSSDSYAIGMGNATEFRYGPVTDYSIKMHMNNQANRGWTWGADGVTPVMALNTQGKLQISNNIGIGTAPTGNLASGRALAIGDGDTGFKQMGDGQLAFFANNGERMRVSSNGNVGIGTTNPTARLQVNGDIKLRGGSNTIRFEDTNSDDFMIHQNSNILYFMNDNNDNGSWDDGDDDRIVMRGQTNGVSMGIGTTNPAEKLEVAGNVQVGDRLIVGAGSSSWDWLDFEGDSNSLRMHYGNTNNELRFGRYGVGFAPFEANPVTFDMDAPANSFRVLGNGNISIANTVTAANFVGNGSGLTGIAGDNLGNHSASTDLRLNNNAIQSAGGTNFDFIRHNDATNRWNFGSDRPDMNNTTFGGGSIAAGSLVLNDRNIVMDNSGDMRIYGDGSSAMYMDSDSSVTTQLIMRDKEDTQYGRLHGSGNGSDFGLLDGDAHWGIRMNKDNFTSFNINNTERMRLLANGNLGIGTSSPADMLHLRPIAYSSNQNGGIRLSDTGNNWNARIALKSNGGGSPRLAFDAPNGTEVIAVNNSNNLGIGTSAPSQKLHVVGNSYLQGTVYLGSTDTALFRDAANRIATDDQFYVRSGSPNTYLYSTNTFLGAGSGDTTLLRGNNFTWNQGVIQGNGNVGIGTTNPGSKLHVVHGGDEMRFTNSGLIVYNPESTTAQVRLGAAWNRPGVYSNQSLNLIGASGLSLGGGPNRNDLYVNTSGNVGIGTTSPSQRLQVAGNIRMDGNRLYFGGGDTGDFLDYATQQGLTYHENGGAQWRLTGNGNNFINGGNVGIGTTTPTGKLHVTGGEVRLDNPVNATHNPSGWDTHFNYQNSGRNLVRGNTEVRGNFSVVAGNLTGNGSGLGSLNASNITAGTLNLARIANNSIPAGKLAANSVGISELSAGGTKNSSTFLRGDNTFAVPPGPDNLGNHRATTTLNMNDREVNNIRALQGKDWDDNTGGTDSKYRLLYRDGAHMFYDGGVAVGGWGNGTWTDLASGDLVVQNQVGIGTTTTTGNLASGASLAIGDSDTGFKQMGDGQLGFYANNGERMRVSSNGRVGIGTTSPGSRLDVAGDIRSSTGRNFYFGTGAQRLHGDNGSALYADSNHSTLTQLIFRDLEDTTYGRLYGSGNGAEFGLMDRDGQWAVRSVRDSHVELRDNNEVTFRAGQGGVSGNYGTVETQGIGKGNWEGFSINGREVFMNNAANDQVGIYNDASNRWRIWWDADDFIIRHTNNEAIIGADQNGDTFLYHNNTWKGRTKGNGFEVAGKVRANEICDRGGNNCTTPANISGGNLTSARYVPGSSRGGEMSSRNVSTPLNFGGLVTFYAANQDTANYLCRTKQSKPFGYWRTTGLATAPGWSYGNLAITAYDPTVQGSRNEICTSGYDCINKGIHYGGILECYDAPSFGTPGAYPALETGNTGGSSGWDNR